MLLITMKEWLGPRKDLSNEQRARLTPMINPVAFATSLPLGAAIDRIYAYQTSFNVESEALAMELTLLTVAQIDELSDDQIVKANIRKVENLLSTTKGRVMTYEGIHRL